MPKPKLFLDFDGTLFDWHQYVPWLDDMFVKRFNTTPQAYTSSYGDHHTVVYDGLRLYHHARHIKTVTGKPWKQVAKLIEESDHPHFCFEEVHDVLDELRGEFDDIRLLTFGREGFQRHKIGLCDVLDGLDVHVVGKPKGEFLAREFADAPGILVDDKYPIELPDHWQHIWINREEPLEKPKKLKKGVWQISSLTQLPKLLANGIVDTRQS